MVKFVPRIRSVEEVKEGICFDRSLVRYIVSIAVVSATTEFS